ERLIADAAEHDPALEDYALWFRARAAARAGRPGDAANVAATLAAEHPDSVWIGPAALMRGRLIARGGDLALARNALLDARKALARGTRPWVVAPLTLGEIADRLGDPETALGLAQEVR